MNYESLDLFHLFLRGRTRVYFMKSQVFCLIIEVHKGTCIFFLLFPSAGPQCVKANIQAACLQSRVRAMSEETRNADVFKHG